MPLSSEHRLLRYSLDNFSAPKPAPNQRAANKQTAAPEEQIYASGLYQKQKPYQDLYNQNLGNQNTEIGSLEGLYKTDSGGNKTFGGTADQLAHLQDLYGQRDSTKDFLAAQDRIGTASGKPAGYVDTATLKPYSSEGRAGVPETPQQFQERIAAAEQTNAALLGEQTAKQQQDLQRKQFNQSQTPGTTSSTPVLAPNEKARLQEIATARKVAREAGHDLSPNDPIIQEINSKYGKSGALGAPAAPTAPATQGTAPAPATPGATPAPTAQPSQTPPASNTPAASSAAPTPQATIPQAPGTSQPTPQGTVPLAVPSLSAGLPPEYQAILTPLETRMQGLAQFLQEEIRNGRTDTLAAQQQLNIQAEADKRQAGKDWQDKLAFQSALDAHSHEYQEEVERQQLLNNKNAEDNFVIDQTRAEQVQRVQNAQTEMQNRLASAKFGVGFNDDGLKYMQSEAQKGVEALGYIIQKTAQGSKEFADQRNNIIQTFGQDMKTADLNSISNYNTAYKDYQTSLLSIKKNLSDNTSLLLKENRERTDKYNEQLIGIDKELGNAYKEVYTKAIEQHVHIDELEMKHNEWKSDYKFNVDKTNNEMAFNQDKFNKEYQQKQLELSQTADKLKVEDFQKQNTVRMTVVNQARNDVQADKNVSAYDSLYRPAWDQFEVAYAMPEGTASRNETITKAFEQLTHGTYATDPNLLQSVIPWLKVDKIASDGDIGAMHDVAQGIYSKAQERKNDAVTRVMAGVQKTNLQFTNDFFKIQPSDLGITTTPLSSEVLQVADSLPPDTKNKITSFRIGSKNVTSTYELQLRLQEADRSFYADTGEHIQVNESFRSSGRQQEVFTASGGGTKFRAAPPGSSMHERGMAVDIADTQWKIAAPYLLKAGLKQLPASIDQEDPGHFSLNGQ